MKPYAELLEFNQPNPIRRDGFTRIRDSFRGLSDTMDVPATDDGMAVWEIPIPERISEFAGRWDYGSKNAERLGQTAKDGTPIIRKWIESGEQSMLEMGHATFFIECSRVVSHELVRHRLMSFQQESQRFTKYDDEKPEELFFMAPEFRKDYEYYAEYDDSTGPTYKVYDGVMEDELVDSAIVGIIDLYKELRKGGVPPQIARYVLPNAMRTRMIVSANIREWRHVLKLRLHSSAQPEMRELMQQVYDQLIEVFPQSLEGVLDEGRGIR